MWWESATKRPGLQTILNYRKILIVDHNRLCYKVVEQMEDMLHSKRWLGVMKSLLNVDKNLLMYQSNDEVKFIIKER